MSSLKNWTRTRFWRRGALSAFKRVEVRAVRGALRRPKYLTGAQKKSAEGRPTGDLLSPLKIEVRSALRAPPDERPAGAP